MVMYDSVSGPDGPVLELGLKVGSAQWDYGPSATVERFDDPALLAAGRLAVRTLGCRGFADIGFIRDAAGQLWHVDANCRPWGNMISLLPWGIDFIEAYIHLVRPESCAAGQSRPQAAPIEAPVLPFMLYEAASRRSPRAIVSLSRRFAKMCWRGPGLPYAAIVFAKLAYLLLWPQRRYNRSRSENLLLDASGERGTAASQA
jgi:hypothetical protein